MSDELKWCKHFLKTSYLMFYHPRKRIRKKNIHRRNRLINYAIKRWGYFPVPPEWILKE